MNNRPMWFVLFIVFLISSCRVQKVIDSNPSFQVSNRSLFKIKKDQAYTFGYLEVPENRSVKNGKSIKLPVYIFKSRNPNPQPDPIIYTVGGPGSSTMPSAQYMAYYQYLDDRDFILIEQRGTAYAQPHLDCPEWTKAMYQSNLPGLSSDQKDSLLATAAQQCKTRLESQGIDLNSYNTLAIAADISDLKAALGIKEYNLLTISYSTKIAQVLMRDYPEGIRSVVMDSPLPLEVNYDEESLNNYLSSLNQTLKDCAESPDCNQAFPQLSERLKQYMIDITKNPLAVTIPNPTNGKEEVFYLQGKEILQILSSLSTSEVPTLPSEIHKLLDNDLSSLKSWLSGFFEGPGDGAGMGMRLSVWCAEEFPFNDQKVIAKETQNYPEAIGFSPAVFKKEICDIWSVKPANKEENEAVKSDIPVLLLNGSYDNETPPKWAENIKKNLPNSHHLVFNGWKHSPTTYWNNPCGMEAANAFFNDPTRQPDLDCWKAIKTVDFKK